MAQATKQPEQPSTEALESVREGNRWVNTTPSGEELATWFAENVEIDPNLTHGPYVGGVVLIQATERYKEARRATSGAQVLVERERLVFTPYAKVETRVAYFWDLMDKHDEWLGVIEPVVMPRLMDAGVYNLNLPPGFSRFPMQEPGGIVHYVAATMRARILRADTVEVKTRTMKLRNGEGRILEEIEYDVTTGVPVKDFPPATKQIAMLNRQDDADPFALMKAETGAVGRALGMAGMLVIPGSGIATAEDMQEAQAGAGGGAVAATLPAPEEGGPEAAAGRGDQSTVQDQIALMQTENPEAYERLAAWANERKIDLSAPKDTQLRGLGLQIERLLR